LWCSRFYCVRTRTYLAADCYSIKVRNNKYILKNQNNKIRIKDIARLAGVSEGTVDRVLHNRGEVSERSREAVNKVLKEINYSPNLLARSLALKKHRSFAYLIPKHEPGDYWEMVEKGFAEAMVEFSQYNISIQEFYYDQFDVNSFHEVTNTILNSDKDAVVMAPIFRQETLSFIDKLNKREIPFSFIDSMIENTGFHTYYGQNSYQSGYIAAKLLLNSLDKNAQVIVIRTKRKGAVSNQTLTRNKGFLEYIRENNLSDIQLINVEIQDKDESKNIELLKDVFDKHQNIKAAITFNSKVYKLAKYLHQLDKTEIRLIGYDLLSQNVDYLKKDVVSYLIAQRPDKQAYLTIRDLCRNLILKQDVKNLNYVPIDVLIKENIEDYILFQE
jgi:LacI family transcriptional regulator